MNLLKSLIFIFILILSSCSSIKNLALNSVSDMLSGSGGGGAFMSDPDYKLIGESLPFAIKMYETLHEANPKHMGMSRMTGSLFIMYANAYIELPLLESQENNATEKQRAIQTYLRGAKILKDGIENKYPGFSKTFDSNGDLKPFLDKMATQDAEMFYWLCAGYFGAFNLNQVDFNLLLKLRNLVAILNRINEIENEKYAPAHDLLAIWYSAELDKNPDLAMKHAQQSIALSGGKSIGSYLTLASVYKSKGEYKKAASTLEKCLKIDVDSDINSRLMNVVYKKKANLMLKEIKEIINILK